MGRPASGLDKYLDWQERLGSYKASGLSVDEFCLSEGIPRLRRGCYPLIQLDRLSAPDAPATASLQLHVSHRRLVTLGQGPVDGGMLVDRQGLAAGVSRYELKLGICQP